VEEGALRVYDKLMDLIGMVLCGYGVQELTKID
jgi:hypothetical protein